MGVLIFHAVVIGPLTVRPREDGAFDGGREGGGKGLVMPLANVTKATISGASRICSDGIVDEGLMISYQLENVA